MPYIRRTFSRAHATLALVKDRQIEAEDVLSYVVALALIVVVILIIVAMAGHSPPPPD